MAGSLAGPLGRARRKITLIRPVALGEAVETRRKKFFVVLFCESEPGTLAVAGFG